MGAMYTLNLYWFSVMTKAVCDAHFTSSLIECMHRQVIALIRGDAATLRKMEDSASIERNTINTGISASRTKHE